MIGVANTYNYFRTYDPSIGRYTQSDPIGLQGGLNTYTYAYDNPVNLTDFYGLYPATHGDCGGAPGCRMNNQSGSRRVFVDFASLADEAKAYVCRYGRVTLSASGGVGLGATGRLVITAQGISGYVGVGAGIGLGASATAGGGLSNAQGAGVATTVTANAGAGPGVSANLTAGTNGVTGAAGVGVGLGAGAVAAIGFGGPIVEFENVDCSCLE